MKTKTLISIILLFVFINCEKDFSPVENNRDKNSLIPTAVGNYWVYADSILINDSLEVDVDTTIITGFEIVDGKNGGR